jgi:hypothetical protein
LHFTGVQTWLTKKVAAYLSDKLNAKVEIARVEIDFLKTVVLEGFYVEDLHNDTLLFSERLGVDISLLSIKHKNILLNKVTLEGTQFNLKIYENESDLNLQFIIDHFSKSGSSEKSPWLFGIEQLELINSRFSYNNYNLVHNSEGIDYNHLEAGNLNILFQDIIIAGDTILTKIKNFSLKEKSGFEVLQLSGNAAISSKELQLKKLHIQTPNSDINAKFSFEYEEWKDYREFITNVRMKYQFKHSVVNFADIAYFAPDLIGIDKVVTLKGNLRGTVDNLKGKDISLAFGDHTRYRGDVNIKGLPNIDETYIHLAINQLTTTKKDLEKIPLPPFKEGKTIQTPDNISLLGLIRFTGDFSGFFNDFVAYGDFITNLGRFSSDIALKTEPATGKTIYEGMLTTHFFDVGKFLDVNEIGSVSLSANVKGKGFTKDDLQASLKGKVKHFDFNRYHYKNIDVQGNIANRLFSGSLDVKDENLKMLFDGTIDFTKALPAFEFNADIENIRPAILNIIDRDTSSSLASKIKFDLSGNNLDNMMGEIQIDNLYYSEKDKNYYINKINFSSEQKDQKKILNLQSDLADASISGNYNIEYLLSSVFDLVEKNIIPENEFKARTPVEKVQDFTFNFHLKNLKPVTELFLPQLEIHQNTTFYGNFNSSKEILSLKGSSPLIDFYGIELKNIDINTSIENKILKTEINSSGLFITDSIALNKFAVNTRAQGNEMGFMISWNNDNKTSRNQAEINGSVDFKSLNKFDVRIEPSNIYMADSLWNTTADNIIHFDTSAITIDNLGLFTESQTILVKGNISQHIDDRLQVIFKNFDLGNINFVSEKFGINTEGIINGDAFVSDIYGNLLFNTSMDIENLIINKEVIGNGIIKSEWNTRKESIGLNGKFFRGNIPTLDVTGNYFPKKETNSLDIIIKLEKLQLQMIDNYLEGIVSDLRGWATGEIRMRGEPNKPLFYGKVNLQRVGFLIDYLNTSYSFTNDVFIEPDRIYFNQLTLYDIRGNKSNAFGIVTHKNFSDFNFDIQLEPKNFMALNTQAHHNPLYYGTAFMSGRVAIKGELNKLNIDITAKSEKGTAFNIPLSGTEEITENKFITFINRDSTSVKVKNEYKVDLSGIQMKFELDVTPDAEMQLIFDPKIGDVMKGRGNGHLTMEINTLGNFSIFGEYIIEEGDYLFTLLNVINKRFKVEKGGIIRWTGNPYNAQLDMNAMYKLRTSLYDLGSDIDTNSTRRRVPVSVVLNLKNDLLKPDILFDIQFPGLTDEIKKSQLRSILSSKEEMNQQVFALLTLNRFVTPINSMNTRTAQHAGATATNSTEMLSNQLSNWLSQISNDFDIGVKYRPGDEITPQELEVALSTQLFNDRVVIDGNVGVANNQQAAQNGNALLGDFNIEYKISQDGRLRVKAFNRTNNYNQLFVNTPFTQGVGVFYRVEFNTFDDLKNKYFGWLKRKDPNAEFEPRYEDNDLEFETDEETVL